MTANLTHLQGVDIIKYIMSFCVVALHIAAVYGRFPDGVEWFLSLAVPFFFMTSGYLMMRKLDSVADVGQKREMLLKRAKQIFRLFLIWFVIYIPISATVLHQHGDTVLKIIAKIILNTAMHGSPTFAWPIWFIYSLAIFTFALSYAVGSIKGIRRLAFLVIACYICARIDTAIDKSDLSHTTATIIYYLPFRVLGGGTYIFAGMFCYRLNKKINNAALSLSMIGVSAAMYAGGIPANEIIGGTGLFFGALLLPVRNSATTCISLRNQSMWIYYTHMIFIFAATFIFEASTVSNLQMFVIVGLVTALTALALSRLQTTRRFSFLAKLVR